MEIGAGVIAYSLGRFSGNHCLGSVGADLVRAQLVAEALTLPLKYSVKRTRPDHGSGYAFPSGHSSVTFASATVLHERFGWKAGVPAYAVASYVAASRIQARRHYLSDVIFGAALGIVSGRGVTVGNKHSIVAVPSASRGQAAILFCVK